MSAKRCAKCGTSHSPPRGKKCTRPDATQQSEALGDKLASTLDQISQRLECLESVNQQHQAVASPGAASGVRSHHSASPPSPATQACRCLLDLGASTDFDDSEDKDEETQKLEDKRKKQKIG